MNKQELKDLAIRAGRGCGRDEHNLALLIELADKGLRQRLYEYKLYKCEINKTLSARLAKEISYRPWWAKFV